MKCYEHTFITKQDLPESQAKKILAKYEDIIKDGILLESGVSKHNFEQLTLAESNFPGLVEKLTDLFEFYKAD